jgi:hypothetical protein
VSEANYLPTSSFGVKNEWVIPQLPHVISRRVASLSTGTIYISLTDYYNDFLTFSIPVCVNNIQYRFEEDRLLTLFLMYISLV